MADALKYNQEMDIDKEENECRMIRSSREYGGISASKIYYELEG